MRYLLDANVLIDAERDYYPIDRVPEFWAWLLHVAGEGRVRIPIEVYEEVVAGRGPLTDWLKSNRDMILSKSEVDPQTVQGVIRRAYAPDLNESEIERVGVDPFLAAHALTQPGSVTVVTMEVSKPGRLRANRHLPDVCHRLGVPCINTFELLRHLDFRTDWMASD